MGPVFFPVLEVVMAMVSVALGVLGTVGTVIKVSPRQLVTICFTVIMAVTMVEAVAVAVAVTMAIALALAKAVTVDITVAVAMIVRGNCMVI